MREFIGRRRYPILIYLFGAILAGCSSNPAAVEALSHVGETTTTTSTTTTSTTTTTAANSLRVEELGHFHVDGFNLVWVTDATEETECQQGQLAVQSETGEIVHQYDELGDVGHLALEHGLRGQIALVEYCEEHVVQVLFTNAQIPPANNVPTFVPATVPTEVFSLFNTRFAGFTGLFVGDATFYHDGEDGWNDQVAFTDDGSMQLLADAIGTREAAPHLGLDYVVPTGWETSWWGSDDAYIRLDSPTSDIYLTIALVWDEFEPVAQEDEQYTSFAEQGEPLWRTTAEDRMVHDVWADTVEYRFSSEAGDRSVLVIPGNDRTVVVESFFTDAAGSFEIDLPYLAAQLVRVSATLNGF